MIHDDCKKQQNCKAKSGNKKKGAEKDCLVD